MATLIDMPKLSDTMTTGTLVRWLKNEGDAVADGDMIAEVETDKATMEVECFDDGVLIKQYCGEGAEVAVGDPIAAIGEAGEQAPEGPGPSDGSSPAKDTDKKDRMDAKPEVETSAAPPTPDKVEGERIKASPLARKIAAEQGMDLQITAET